jgi:hypothetical protein
MKKIICALSLVIALIFVSTCYAETAVKKDNYVKIREIQPDLSLPLEVGSDINFEVNVEYYLNEDSATIDLVIQKAEHSGDGTSYIGGDTEVVGPGSGLVTLKAKIKIPDTKAIQIFTPLTLQGQNSSSIVDSRFYKVIKSKNP